MKKILIFVGLIILFINANAITALKIKDIEKPNSDNTTVISTINVDNEGDGEYTSIQDAIDIANPGDIIKVYSGKYKEIIKITVENLILEGINYELGSGSDFGKPEINGEGESTVVQINADNVELNGFIIYGSGGAAFDAGINISSDGNLVKGNLITRNHHGIFLMDCNNNHIKDNTINWNYWDGIHMLDFCYNNVIESNGIESNNVDGVKLFFTDNVGNIIIDNEINSNRWNGVHIMYSVGNEILKNNISSNFWDGVHLGNAKANIIRLNLISSNFLTGILLFEGCSGNKIYHNNIVNNVCFDDGENFWDNDYPNGGNFWADYNGSDEDEDGFGDIPYDVPGGKNKDNYPFMEPIVPPFKPTRPLGTLYGRVGDEYSYTTLTIDLNNDMVKYGWDWNGDYNVDEWTNFYESGSTCTVYHTWIEPGDYKVYVKAVDELGLESEWSDPLPIRMPRSRVRITPFLNFLQNHPLLFQMFHWFIKT